MDVLGVGPLELLFIFLIALIVIGPNDMVKTGRTLGRFLRKIVTSPTWQAVQQTSRDLRHLPNKLIREAGLEEEMNDLNSIKGNVEELSQIRPDLGMDELEGTMKQSKNDISAWTSPPIIPSPPPAELDSREKGESDPENLISKESPSTE